MRTLTIHPSDNVEVDLDTGHKKAKRDIKKGETVIKYGCPIGHATRDIKKDETVHTDNLKTNLDTNALVYIRAGRLRACFARRAVF